MEEVQFDVKSTPSQQNSKIWWIVLCVCIFVLSAIFTFVALSGNDTGTNSPKNKIEITNAKLEVEYSEYLGYSAYITGVAENITNKNFSYVSIEYSVYDASGNNLGTAMDNINNLASGDTWNFKCDLFYYGESRPVSFKLVDITVW